MNDEDCNVLAAEYVLGTLDADERARLEARLDQDSNLRGAVSRWMDDLSGLESDRAQIAPPASVWSGISAAIQGEFPARTRTERANEGQWQRISPGIRCKILHVDADAGIQSYLLRLEPGAELPAHSHRLDEECVVLEGRLRIGEMQVGAGDFHLARAGSSHPVIRADVPTLIYLRGELRDDPVHRHSRLS